MGETEWTPGEIVNISRTGLLFRAAHQLPLAAEFELRFCVPSKPDCSGPEVRCTGIVVRHCAEPGKLPATAGRICRSEFAGETEYL